MKYRDPKIYDIRVKHSKKLVMFHIFLKHFKNKFSSALSLLKILKYEIVTYLTTLVQKATCIHFLNSYRSCSRASH